MKITDIVDSIIGKTNTNTTDIDTIETNKLDTTIIHNAISKATPADNDELALVDSADSFSLKKLTWSNLKATLGSLFATLASPALTGTPTAPTPTSNDNSTKVATTEFVMSKSGILSIFKLLHIQDQKPSGTIGGASVVGDNTRVLNTVLTNNIIGASLASNLITLPAGTYYIEAFSCGYGGTGHKLKLNNVTDVTTPLVGTPAGWISGNGGTISFLSGTIIINTEKVFRVSTYQSQAISNGLGIAVSGAGVIEIYTDIKIWKVD